MSLVMKEIVCSNAPKAIGPYSQGMRCGDFIFLSGQIPLDPETGVMVGTTVEEQTTRVMKNILGVLESLHLEVNHIAKTTVFLKSMSDFPKFNAIYETFLKAPYPARSTVEVARLPKDALVEIEALIFAPIL